MGQLLRKFQAVCADRTAFETLLAQVRSQDPRFSVHHRRMVVGGVVGFSLCHINNIQNPSHCSFAQLALD